MTQEDKELLLKYICMALPYGVVVDYKENEFELPHWKITTIHPETFNGWIGYDKRVGAGSESGSRPFNIGDVKPYLRPMSSMTEEEMDELESITFPLMEKDWNSNENPACVRLIDVPKYMNFILSNHFDFMGLIPKYLAIEVTESNNPYKN